MKKKKKQPRWAQMRFDGSIGPTSPNPNPNPNPTGSLDQWEVPSFDAVFLINSNYGKEK